MTIWEHLDELRRRVIRAAIGMRRDDHRRAGRSASASSPGSLTPYEDAWRRGTSPAPRSFRRSRPADAFVGYLQLSLVGGVVAAAPIIFYQLWAFISPGLYRKEKRLIVPFVLFSTTLFLSGVAFAYYVAFPFTFNYFFSLLGQVSRRGRVLTQRPTLEFYLDFSTRMLLAFGGGLRAPALHRVPRHRGHRDAASSSLKFGRWAVLGSFVVGAVVTPGPEVSSQLAVSGALVALYFLSIGVAFVVGKRKKDTTDTPTSSSG